MSTEIPEASISTTTVDGAALPQVRKPGRVPIKSWVPDLEGSVLDQATNRSVEGNPITRLDYFVLVPTNSPPK